MVETTNNHLVPLTAKIANEHTTQHLDPNTEGTDKFKLIRNAAIESIGVILQVGRLTTSNVHWTIIEAYKGAVSRAISSSVTLGVDIWPISTKYHINTGSSFSIISSQLFDTVSQNPKVNKSNNQVLISAFGVNNYRLLFTQRIILHVKLGNLSWDFPFLVATDIPYPIILGGNFLQNTEATIDFKIQRVIFTYATPNMLYFNRTKFNATHHPNHFHFGANLTSSQRDKCFLYLHLTYHINKKDMTTNFRTRPYQYTPPKL